jgi:site-specific DNA-methyltransferase (adenine-specific)
MSNKLHHGDCLEVMPTLDADSVDAIISDPPYGLSFMGKAWDHGVPGEVFWREALRVAKPGAHLLAFGGTRTFHRLTVAIEDAGWEIRDCVMWVYGSGFPKSHNGEWGGTALKPAWEPIIVARKPLIGTVAANVLAHGTGGLNIDECRVGTQQTITIRNGDSGGNGAYGRDDRKFERVNPPGRWPANLIHDGSDEVVAGFPDAGGGFGVRGKGGQTYANGKGFANTLAVTGQEVGYGDTGSAARFFYCAKASKADRDEGCEGMPQTIQQSVAHGDKQYGTLPYTNEPREMNPRPRSNNHPTVKPTALMRYLCKLVTPLNGIILDPFMGSGSTGKAATLERFNFIGIDLSAEYVAIAQARIDAATKQIAEQLQYGSS